MTLDATRMLQSRDNDILDAVHMIESIKKHFSSVRSEKDYYHGEWYKITLALAEKVNVEESKSQTCRKQTNRSNPPSDDISDHFKGSLSISTVDHVNIQLNKRFDSSLTSYHSLVIVPLKLLFCIARKEEAKMS